MTDSRRAPIRATDVSVVLGDVEILKSVSFEARRGELVGLIGPNGAGKSTLLRALAGLLRPTSGSVRLGDIDLRSMKAGERARRIAFMPQRDAMHPFTALEMALMGRYAHLGRFEIEGRRDRQIARDAMARTETDIFEDRQLDSLSGGERQRVVMARALAQQAEVMLLDEPSSSLDIRHRLSVMEILRDEIAERGVAVVVALHDISLAAMYYDRLVLLADGEVAAEGSPSEALTARNLREVFGVEAKVQTDPSSGLPNISLIGPAK